MHSQNDRLVHQNSSIKDALAKIDKNSLSIIVVHDDENMVVGIATDGDIRRHLLAGGLLSDQIQSCMNMKFVWRDENTSPELLIKLLDNDIRAIPLLNRKRELVELVTRQNVLTIGEGKVFVRARAPVRISFSGGGSDLTHFFLENKVGAVINATISLYAHASLRERRDNAVHIRSFDLGEELFVEEFDELSDLNGPFGLIKALLKLIRPSFGFELSLHCDFPMKSGLGGSSALLAAILGCFNQLRRDRWDRYELAELAYRAERHMMGIRGGWQDQYATIFGGFNFMEFKMDQNVVHPLRLQEEMKSELEESLILCNTGLTHDSGMLHEDQHRAMASPEVLDLVNRNVDLCYEMRDQLLRGRLSQFAGSMHQAWQLKRRFSETVSSRYLDDLYEGAIKHGAVGGKLLGAGGGGFFLFFVFEQDRYRLMKYLAEHSLSVQPFRFESSGLESWTVRDGSGKGGVDNHGV